MKENKALILMEGTTNVLTIDYSNDIPTLTGENNKDIHINPQGTGLLKYGTEQAIGSSRDKMIPIKTAAGTTVYLKTFDA
jgi:hypothetical protein